MKKRSKILFVLENYYPKVGGVETLFKSLCENLAKCGYSVKVITSAAKGSPSFEVQENVEIYRLWSSSRYLFTLFAFFKIFRTWEDYSLIHTTSYNAALPTFLAGKLKRKKVVITFHEVWGKLWFKLPFVKFLSRILYYIFEWIVLKLPFDKFIAVSEHTKDDLQNHGIATAKVIAIPNGIDYASITEIKSSIQKTPHQKFTYLYFGRLGISKGLDILVKSAVRVKRNLPNSQLVIVTSDKSGSIRKSLEKMIKDNGLNDHIVWKDSMGRKELFNEILNAHCVVVPSYAEGFGFAAAETIALGTPLVCSMNGALREVVSGKYFPVEQLNEKSLAQAIMHVYKKRYKETPIKRFELKSTTSRYIELYAELMKEL